MRYDTEVIFVTERDGYYDPVLGEHIDPTRDQKLKMANVTDLGTNRSKTLFGDIKQGAKVIRLLRRYDDKWDYVVIDGKTYQSVTSRDLRLKNTFIVQEVTIDG